MPVIIGASVGGALVLAMAALGIYRVYLRPRRLRKNANLDSGASGSAPIPTRQAGVVSAVFVGDNLPESDEDALKPPPPYEETVDTFVDSEAQASSSMSGPSSSTHIIYYDVRIYSHPALRFMLAKKNSFGISQTQTPVERTTKSHAAGPEYKQREPEVSVKEPLLPQNRGAGPPFRKK
jgi:hypothetical protein